MLKNEECLIINESEDKEEIKKLKEEQERKLLELDMYQGQHIYRYNREK